MKNDVIKNAYAEYWDLFDEADKKYILDNDGWHHKWNHILHWEMVKTGFEIIDRSYGIGTSWKPKSLQGIENNNGWIGFDGLTMKDGWYLICQNNERINEPVEVKGGKMDKNYSWNCTHYNLIFESLNPFY